MEIILFDKEYGFYEKEQILGKEGHFITSPLISEYFSHCVARNFIQIYNEEKLNNILECGAGNAELAINLLKYLKNKRVLPNKYYFFEKSSHFIDKQKIAIKELELDNSVEFVF